MKNNAIQITDYELLGQVLDGKANELTRQMVILNLIDPLFEECFLIALKATKLFDDKIDIYETVQ
ncbi:hypothetical protein NW211_12690 [Barnesiella sp. ET7]|uniref:hypothetical protein n=1 Tax=Barnesiella sp. ET7 TaxID=2972460 RepID=UPI0021AC9449|nr:hypothetical protein [Barnesiella sp. ET7]MCR8912850.1 hypothetical protein [Barnesiella sp. ET7]